MPRLLFLLLVLVLGFSSCQKSDADQDTNLIQPRFVSLTADKDTILFGGGDPAILTCVATGSNLSYQWEVDLGDIFPMNPEGSVVRFTGSECCIGNKYIRCTISNELESVSDTVLVYIRYQ